MDKLICLSNLPWYQVPVVYSQPRPVPSHKLDEGQNMLLLILVPGVPGT